MENIITYSDYQQKIKNIKTPEDAAVFARDMAALAMKKFEQKPEEPEDEDVIEKPQSRSLPKYIEAVPKIKKSKVPASLWYDIAANDTEAMIISLYAKGMTTRDIASYMKGMHGIEMSQPGVSTITDKVFPLVKEWQSRPLSSCYPVVYMDGLHFKVREAGKIVPKVAYIALGISQYGHREVLGIWVSDSEGAKFWLHVLNDLKTRGVEDIIFACVDGLRGFPDAIKTLFPRTEVQVCIVHQIRHTIMFVPHKDKEQFCDDLKDIYTAPNEDAGMTALHELMEKWPQYRSYLKSWEDNWSNLAPFFNYPQEVRRMIYTTNTIENLNRQFRKVTKTTTIFPHDDALIKLLWLAQADFTQNWTLAMRHWGAIMAQLTILFPGRVQF
jgi:putative transposase